MDWESAREQNIGERVLTVEKVGNGVTRVPTPLHHCT